MVEFRDLPVELLSDILQHLVKPSQLAEACLVNKLFYPSASHLLYQHIFLASWHKNAKGRVVQLFQTLQHNKQLALLVLRLDVRDFPKPAPSEVIDSLIQGLSNCRNLIACTWTRDGSLSSALLETLHILPYLTELEINGNDEGQYDASLLPRFDSLKRIRVIMPKPQVVQILPNWIEANRNGLTSLTLICKRSPLVTDELFIHTAPYLSNLEHLSLTGCIRVTHRGVLAALSQNADGIKVLCLEGMSPHFDMSEFRNACTQSKLLRRLHSITLTIPEDFGGTTTLSGPGLPQTPSTATGIRNKAQAFYINLRNLLHGTPLTHFQVYATQTFYNLKQTDTFFDQLVLIHGHRLKRLTLHRMYISLDAIHRICKNCQKLEELFIVVSPEDLPNLHKILLPASSLRTLHINFIQSPNDLHSSITTHPLFFMSDFQSIIHSCSPTLTQIGCNSRVWQIGREVKTKEDGTKVVHRVLLPYEGFNIPEPFLVVRT
ncbi:hypothetical protein AX16_003293 [Volvariella volvacea WC 439]|nr:hypothetical protein AX16_003293 [Volvariella volvacea WC 439]